MTRNNIKNIFLFISITLLIIICLFQNKQIEKEVEKVIEIKNEFIIAKKINDSLIIKNKVFETRNNEQIKTISEKVLGKTKGEVKVYSQNFTQVKIKDIIGEFKDTILLKDTIIITDSIEIPFKYKNEWYLIEGKVIKQGVYFDSIEIKDSFFYRIIEIKKGFLKRKKETQIEFAHTNPYVKTTGENTIILKEKKKIIKNTAIISGVLAIIITTLQLIK